MTKHNCEHEVDVNIPVEPDDGTMMMRFRQACVWSRCVRCGKRLLLVDDTGVFDEEELENPMVFA